MQADSSIDESQKRWARKVTQDEYDIAVGLRCAECLALLKKGKCICPKPKG